MTVLGVKHRSTIGTTVTSAEREVPRYPVEMVKPGMANQTAVSDCYTEA